MTPGSGAEDITQSTYNAKFNEVTTLTDALGNVTTYAYDAHGNLLKTTDAMGNTVTNQYNAQGMLISVTDANGGVTTYSYDAYGNVIKVVDAVGNIITNTYDSRSRLIDTTDTYGHHVQYTYDGLGHELTMTADASAGETVTTTYTYLPGGQLQTRTDGLGHTTVFTYDQANRVTTKVEEERQTRGRFGSNAADLTTTYKYDDDGNLKSEVDPGNTLLIY